MTIQTIEFEDKWITFWVPGVPAPGGSKRFVGHARSGKAILIDDAGARNRHWRELVAMFAHPHTPDALLTGPLEVTFTFIMPRIKSHFYTDKKRKGQLRLDAPSYHTVKPDALKLARSTEDALTGVIWADDATTCILSIYKNYGDKPGCQVRVKQL